jgi:ABC-type multidrug transport system ATPase subunit
MSATLERPLTDPAASGRALRPPVVEARAVGRRFRETVALAGLDLAVEPGGIHALLGPNGAGKTTLLRILAGLLAPSEGSVSVLGVDVGATRRARQLVGLVPSGDRTFYLRISGLENLVFFGRLHGYRRRVAAARAREVLDAVGLVDAAGRPVGLYSHGMQKRLSVARALLTRPRVLLVDEATHDLDPEGARRVKRLVDTLADDGVAVVWATQRLEEIRGFAHEVTLLDAGRPRFQGSVDDLARNAVPRRYVVQLRDGAALNGRIERALAGIASLAPAGTSGGEHFVLELAEGAILGDALGALAREGADILACRNETSELEEAFLALTGGAG